MRAAALLTIAAAAGACAAAPPRARPGATPAARTTPGHAPPEARAPATGRIAISVYTVGPATPLAVDVALRAGRARIRGVQVLASPDESAEAPAIFAAALPASALPPPSRDALRFFAVGLSPAEASALAGAQGLTAMAFAVRVEPRHAALRGAYAVAADVAEATGGSLWDADTRQGFSAEAWRERRLDAWDGDVPLVPLQIAVHSYRDGDLVRAVTLGMSRFGLPDLAADHLPASFADAMAEVLLLACQARVEGATPGPDGALALDVRAVRAAPMRARWQARSFDNATGHAAVHLARATPAEGDADNALERLAFDDGPHLHEAQEALLGALFGASDGLVQSDHDEELLAASRRARRKLATLASRFGQLGRATLLVKVPFPTDDGSREWMWVEIVRWRGEVMEGVLMNDPYLVAALRSGARVTVQQKDVFDYLLRRPDGTHEGGETSDILLARQRRRAP